MMKVRKRRTRAATMKGKPKVVLLSVKKAWTETKISMLGLGQLKLPERKFLPRSVKGYKIKPRTSILKTSEAKGKLVREGNLNVFLKKAKLPKPKLSKRKFLPTSGKGYKIKVTASSLKPEKKGSRKGKPPKFQSGKKYKIRKPNGSKINVRTSTGKPAQKLKLVRKGKPKPPAKKVGIKTKNSKTALTIKSPKGKLSTKSPKSKSGPKIGKVSKRRAIFPLKEPVRKQARKGCDKKKLCEDSDFQEILTKKRRTLTVTSARIKKNHSFMNCPVPCRQAQFEVVWDFLRKGIEERDSRCLYISGVPGSGKTLVCNSVVAALQRMRPGAFKLISVNCLSLGKPDRIWNRIYFGLGFEDKVSKIETFLKVKKFLYSKHLPIILVVDELDQLLDAKQHVLYQLLEWTSHPSCRFSFIAIFNTMNVPETSLAGRNASRIGFARVVFPAYTHQELQLIVSSYLGTAKSRLLQDAMILLSKKVAGISGDARRAIEIANRTLEIIETNEESATKAIQDAFTELFSSPQIHCLRHCSKLEKDIIRMLALILQSAGTNETLLSNVIRGVISGASYDGVTWSVEQILAGVSRLYSMRLILIETARPSIHGRIALEVAVEDINFAFGISTHFDGCVG